MIPLAWSFAVALALVLISAWKIDALRGTPRSRSLSFAGGAAVAYVFLKLLPELMHAQQKLREAHGLSEWMRHHLLFLTSLAGALAFFGIERGAKLTKERRRQQGKDPRSAAWVCWTHHLLMAVYVAMIGYLLFRGGERSLPAVAAFGAIMGVHFAGVSVALDDDYRSLFSKIGRWLLAACLLAGAAFGYLAKLPERTFDLILGVLAGAVVFSVVKEEIPPSQQSRFWAVAAGAGAAALLLRVTG